MCLNWHFFPNECQTFHKELKAKIIWYSALANAVTIVFYVEADIPFIKWTPNGKGDKMDCHASKAARPQRVTGLTQPLLGPAQESTCRFGCVISKFSSPKSSSQVDQREVRLAQPGCLPVSHSTRTRSLGTLPLIELSQRPQAQSMKTPACGHVDSPLSVLNRARWQKPQLENFFSILGLLREGVCSVVFTA